MKPTYNAIIFSNGTLNYGVEKPGRNEPCPCGSKKKFKNCCLRKFEDKVSEMLVEANKEEKNV